MSQLYNALFDPDLAGDPTLQEVLDNPQINGGEAMNNVADFLSAAHPGVDLQGDRVEDSCPLSADEATTDRPGLDCTSRTRPWTRLLEPR